MVDAITYYINDVYFKFWNLLFVLLLSGLVNIMCGFGLQQQQFKDVATKVN